MGLSMTFFRAPNCQDNYKYTNEIGYLGKANAIHNWLEKNVVDCVENYKLSEVTRTNLEDLRAICVEVIEHPSRASDLLPTSYGFFFGSLAYDDDYFMNLEFTIEIVDNALNETNWDEETILYFPSW